MANVRLPMISDEDFGFHLTDSIGNLENNSTSVSQKENETVFEFDALPMELKVMVWNQMTHVKENLEDPQLEQDYRMSQSRVNRECTLSCLTKLTDFRIFMQLEFLPNSNLAPLTTLHVDYVGDQGAVDSLPLSFHSSYNTLTELKLEFADELENYDPLNEFLSGFTKLEFLTLHCDQVGLMQDQKFLEETLQMESLKSFFFTGHIQPLSAEFIYEMRNLKIITFEVLSGSGGGRHSFTSSLLDQLEKNNRIGSIEKINVILRNDAVIDDGDDVGITVVVLSKGPE